MHDLSTAVHPVLSKLRSYSCVWFSQETSSGLKRKASEMSGGSFGSAVSRGSMDSGTTGNSKVSAVCLFKNNYASRVWSSAQVVDRQGDSHGLYEGVLRS